MGGVHPAGQVQTDTRFRHGFFLLLFRIEEKKHKFFFFFVVHFGTGLISLIINLTVFRDREIIIRSVSC